MDRPLPSSSAETFGPLDVQPGSLRGLLAMLEAEQPTQHPDDAHLHDDDDEDRFYSA